MFRIKEKYITRKYLLSFGIVILMLLSFMLGGYFSVAIAVAMLKGDKEYSDVTVLNIKCLSGRTVFTSLVELEGIGAYSIFQNKDEREAFDLCLESERKKLNVGDVVDIIVRGGHEIVYIGKMKNVVYDKRRDYSVSVSFLYIVCVSGVAVFYLYKKLKKINI